MHSRLAASIKEMGVLRLKRKSLKHSAFFLSMSVCLTSFPVHAENIRIAWTNADNWRVVTFHGNDWEYEDWRGSGVLPAQGVPDMEITDIVGDTVFWNLAWTSYIDAPVLHPEFEQVPHATLSQPLNGYEIVAADINQPYPGACLASNADGTHSDGYQWVLWQDTQPSNRTLLIQNVPMGALEGRTGQELGIFSLGAIQKPLDLADRKAIGITELIDDNLLVLFEGTSDSPAAVWQLRRDPGTQVMPTPRGDVYTSYNLSWTGPIAAMHPPAFPDSPIASSSIAYAPVSITSYDDMEADTPFTTVYVLMSAANANQADGGAYVIMYSPQMPRVGTPIVGTAYPGDPDWTTFSSEVIHLGAGTDLKAVGMSILPEACAPEVVAEAEEETETTPTSVTVQVVTSNGDEYLVPLREAARRKLKEQGIEIPETVGFQFPMGKKSSLFTLEDKTGDFCFHVIRSEKGDTFTMKGCPSEDKEFLKKK